MRPQFVTNEDIIRWSAAIDQDTTFPPEITALPLLREVAYAGNWLSEQLYQLGCNELLITRITYTAGQLCFGRDPWEVVQEVLKAYKDNDLEFEIDYNEDRN
jgi:hypothetical protein